MKILVIGGGGREHAVIRALRKSPKAAEVYALPGNGGIAADAVCVPGSATDIEGAVDFAREAGIDFAVVTPDDPLALGCVDALHAAASLPSARRRPRRDRVQQGLCQGPDAEVPHTHRRL